MSFDRKLPLAQLFKVPKDIVFTPIGFNGPGTSAKPLKDDFTKEEIAYAGNVDATSRHANEKKDSASQDWRRQLLELRREGRRKGMTDADAKVWAAAEFRRRQKEAK